MASPRPDPGKARVPDAGEPRVEVDHIRFEREPLPGGLWRHHPVRYVIEVARQRARTDARES